MLKISIFNFADKNKIYQNQYGFKTRKCSEDAINKLVERIFLFAGWKESCSIRSCWRVWYTSKYFTNSTFRGQVYLGRKVVRPNLICKIIEVLKYNIGTNRLLLLAYFWWKRGESHLTLQLFSYMIAYTNFNIKHFLNVLISP